MIKSYKAWKYHLNNIKFNNYFKDNILPIIQKIIKRFSKRFDIIPIIDQTLKTSFDSISNYNNIIISLDAEFQHVVMGEIPNSINETDGTLFVREFGMLIFVKDLNNVWYYIGHVFVNFDLIQPPISGPSNAPLYATNTPIIRHNYILSKYASVTDKTKKLMEKNDKVFDTSYLFEELLQSRKNRSRFINQINKIMDKLEDNKLLKLYLSDNQYNRLFSQLNELQTMKNTYLIESTIRELQKMLANIPFQVYGFHLLNYTKYLGIFNDQHHLYMMDQDVVARTLELNKEKELLSYIDLIADRTSFIIKGKMDIIAINNSYRYVNNKIIRFEYTYDIELFNYFSKYKFGNARLETTYLGLLKSIHYKKHAKSFFDKLIKLIGEKAHNPVADSLFTIVVATVMNLGIYDAFKQKIRINQSGGDKYYYKYQKYKQKYLLLKKAELE